MNFKTTVFALLILFCITQGCARNNPSDVAIDRWKGCSMQIAKLDSTLLTSNLRLPNNFSQITLASEELEPIKSLDSLYSLLNTYDQPCKPIGARIYKGFRVYQLAFFTRRLTEYDISLEEIREQHLFLIGDLKQVKTQHLGLLNNSKKAHSELLNDSTHYLIFQNY